MRWCIRLNLRKVSFCGSTMFEQYNFMWFRLIVSPCRLFTKRKFHYIDLLGKMLSRCTLQNNCFLNLVKFHNTVFYVLSIHSTKSFHVAQTSWAQILQLFNPAQPFSSEKEALSQTQKHQWGLRDAHPGPKFQGVNKGEWDEHTKICWPSSILGHDCYTGLQIILPWSCMNISAR